MRYLRQFSRWKDRQSAAISLKTEELKTQNNNLTQAKAEHDRALKVQKAEEAVLRQQYGKQDVIVAELKKNGEALKTHLGKKQVEANQLRNRISELIAEEERKAAEERARQEAARKAEEERIAREKAQKEAEERAREERERQLLAESQEVRKVESDGSDDVKKATKIEASKEKKKEQKKKMLKRRR